MALVNENPWSSDVALTGTDGWQFEPGTDDGGSVTIFSSDVARPLGFNYVSQSELSGYNSLTFELDQTYLARELTNADNIIYNIKVDGTTNLTTVLDAPAFASNGLYYLFSTDSEA